MIKKLFSIVTVIFCLQTALFASEKDDQIIYAMLMNQIQYSLLTVQHYKSRVVLEKEYDNIICKIDKTKLADENGEAIEAYSNLLDTLTELKLGENEKQFLTIQAEKERKQSFTKVLEGAPSAVGMAAIAFAGGNPVQAVSGLLFTGVSAVFNYRNAVNSVENSLNASLFRISQNDIHILDGERNSLFKTYSRFITKYKIPKKYEIKEDQMKWLVESLDSLDAASKVRLLETKKDIFEVFTPFWFFLGSAYQEVGNEKKAKECYAEFEKQKRKYSIIDNDTYYTELAKNMIKMCHDDNREGKMKPYIAIIEADQTVASENENRLYLAELYYSLGQEAAAKEKLRLVMDDSRDLVAAAHELYTLYDATTKEKIKKGDAGFTKNESISRAMILPVEAKIEDAGEADKGFVGLVKGAATSIYSFITSSANVTAEAELKVALAFSFGEGAKSLSIKNAAGNTFYADKTTENGEEIFVFPDGAVKMLGESRNFTAEIVYEDGRHVSATYDCALFGAADTRALYSALSILEAAGLEQPALDEIDLRTFVASCAAAQKDASYKKKTDSEKRDLVEAALDKARRAYLTEPFAYYRAVARLGADVVFECALTALEDTGRAYTFSKYGDAVRTGSAK